MPPLDRSRPPAAGTVPPFRLPAFVDTRLDNGLRVLLLHAPQLPLVHAEMLLGAGAASDPQGRAGLATLTAGLLDEGTHQRSALQLAKDVERLGGYLGSAADWDRSYVGARTLPEHSPSGLELVAEVVTQPSFPAEDFERLRQQRVAEILRRRDQPAALALRSLQRALYAETAYGLPMIGTEQSVRALHRDDCAAFHQQHAAPRNSALVAAGDFQPEAYVELANRQLGSWQPERTVDPARVDAEPLESLDLCVVDRPGSAQAELRLGLVSVPRNHPGYPARLVTSTLLGGKFTSRLNLNLREKHGFTYGVQGYFTARRGPGPFIVGAAVASNSVGASLSEVQSEIQRLRDEPVGAEELQETSDYLAGVFPYTLQTAADLARRLADVVAYDLPADYYDTYPAVLREVSADEVQSTARELLDPARMAVVAVGRAEELVPQLEPFGPVRVEQPAGAD